MQRRTRMHRPARILGILIAFASFLTLAGSLPGIGVARQQRGIQNGPEFDQLTAANGSIHDSSLRAFKGSKSMRATYDGTGAVARRFTTRRRTSYRGDFTMPCRARWH